MFSDCCLHDTLLDILPATLACYVADYNLLAVQLIRQQWCYKIKIIVLPKCPSFISMFKLIKAVSLSETCCFLLFNLSRTLYN